ncbi:MAG: 2-isopropylmalate synthase [Magnetococcales bacterium]|nr:2-isopropylmalate synthase [Magnetococcales bacterium]MBF0113492.1 2-isopropylmalate synthase [Magnetococcales bacterium]
MLNTQQHKYHPVPVIPMPQRRWPDQILQHAPAWCSIDLRDGNQALATPMSPERKQRFFEQLLHLGFREIEAGFPAASVDDFAFLRQLVAQAHQDVAIQVLTSARPEHIARTFAALEGMPQAIVHFYLSTSPLQRRLVFGVETHTLIDRAVRAAEQIRQLSEKHPDTRWRWQFSPESFSATEPEVALAICEAVAAVWEPTPDHKIILNLPATVELASPNRYADQIEWFAHHFSRRAAVILSIHPHNDRGCAVAAAELALLAGAERVEGALFGNGERTGNLDLVTLAMNLYSQGIPTGLDFSRMDEVVACYETCTGMTVPPRQPYAGELVFTAFSGSHQDAIRKGLNAWKEDQPWEVPYLPIDPRDVGADLSGVIRVNSQSGKAGAAHLLESEKGIRLPKNLEREFGQMVQIATEQRGQELSQSEIGAVFTAGFCQPSSQVRLQSYRLTQENQCTLALQVGVGERSGWLYGSGNGPIDAACHALPGPWRIEFYQEQALTTGSQAQAIAFITLMGENGCHGLSGVGIHHDIVTASLQALLAAINRQLQRYPHIEQQQLQQAWHLSTSQ